MPHQAVQVLLNQIREESYDALRALTNLPVPRWAVRLEEVAWKK